MLKGKIIHSLRKFYIRVHEKTYRNNGTRLKYLLYDNDASNTLIVGLQACANPPTYNYVRSLSNVGATRLYIKDDFAADKRGSYYLGEKGKNNVEKTVIELINKVLERVKNRQGGRMSKIIFIGSSKGGYAALNFALEYDNSYAIVAAPQYLLGDYLNCDVMKEQMKDIVGDVTDEKIEYLNNRLKNKILKRNKDKKQTVYIQYSNIEHTFEDHVKYLLFDLQEANINVYEEVLHYSAHRELYKYFPSYLYRTVKNIISEDNY